MKTYLKFFRNIWLRPHPSTLVVWFVFVIGPLTAYQQLGEIWRLISIPVLVLIVPVLIWMQVKVEKDIKKDELGITCN